MIKTTEHHIDNRITAKVETLSTILSCGRDTAR